MAADLGQVLVHCLDVDLRHDDRGADAALRADRAEQVGRFKAAVARGAGTRATLRPDTGQRALLANTVDRRWRSTVGEPDLHRPAERFRRHGGGHEIARAALKTVCSSGLLKGCCGRTDSRRNDSLRSSLPTVARAARRQTPAQSAVADRHSASAPHRPAHTPDPARPIPPPWPAVRLTAEAVGHYGAAGRTNPPDPTCCSGVPSRAASDGPSHRPQPPPPVTSLPIPGRSPASDVPLSHPESAPPLHANRPPTGPNA